jgi:hypothetical protein
MSELTDIIQDVLDKMITVTEGEERFVNAGGDRAHYRAWANKNRDKVFHGCPITGDEDPNWPY